MFESLSNVYKVVEQKTLSYKDNIAAYQPSYVVHGDDWVTGFQRPIRDEVVSELAVYGGQLVEFPYAGDKKYEELEKHVRVNLSGPDMRQKGSQTLNWLI